MARRSIIVGIRKKGRSGRSWGSNSAWLCWSSAHLVDCGPDEPSWTRTQIWVQAGMLDYSLNMTARSIQGWQRCQWCNSPTRRWPSRSREPFGLKSAIEHWRPARMLDNPLMMLYYNHYLLSFTFYLLSFNFYLISGTFSPSPFTSYLFTYLFIYSFSVDDWDIKRKCDKISPGRIETV